MKTFLELFALAYLTPEEIRAETSIPIETIYAAINGKRISEQDARRILKVVNSRLRTTIQFTELDVSKIQWES